MSVSILHNPAPSLFTSGDDWESGVRSARVLHRSLPGFTSTPLVELPCLAAYLGVGRLFVKDESQRLGLNAFKVLGAAYAVARMLSERLQLSCQPGFPELAATARERLPEATLVAATDGNHGRGVAWVAQQLGLRAVIYLPAGAASSRLQAIKDLGGQAILTELNYDDAVRLAAGQAEQQGWLLVQDTAWPGYSRVPAWIMQGYATMAAEAEEQLGAAGAQVSHLLLQTGVGSMAAAVQRYYLAHSANDAFKTVVMEPEQAACFFHSMQVGDGAAHSVGGDLHTIMAGLACGEPNPLAWPVLSQSAAAFASCPDYVAALGMRLLASPLGTDRRVEAGESGAVGLGLLTLLMRQPTLLADRQRLGIDNRSTIMIFNTEGATDPENYRRVVWAGAYPTPIDFNDTV